MVYPGFKRKEPPGNEDIRSTKYTDQHFIALLVTHTPFACTQKIYTSLIVSLFFVRINPHICRTAVS